MVPTPQVDHVDVAAYVLGILDEADEAAFARHFARCQRCRLEYRELADLPMLLDQLKPARTPHRHSSRQPAQPGKRVLGQALSRVGEARRTRIRTLWLAAAAVIVLLVAVPLIVLRSVGNGSQVAAPTVTVSASPTTPSAAPNTGTDVVAGARTVNGENAAAGIKATIGIEPQPWGTKINLELRATTGPLQCELAAISRSGDVQILLSWQVPKGGVGVPGGPSPEPLRLQGGAGFSADDIDRFELRRTDGGPNLLNIPA